MDQGAAGVFEVAFGIAATLIPELTNARARLAEAMDFAAKFTVAAHAEGMTEVGLSQHLGVNRLTIRKGLGK